MNKKKNFANKTFTNAMVVWLAATMMEQGITEESIHQILEEQSQNSVDESTSTMTFLIVACAILATPKDAPLKFQD